VAFCGVLSIIEELCVPAHFRPEPTRSVWIILDFESIENRADAQPHDLPAEPFVDVEHNARHEASIEGLNAKFEIPTTDCLD